MVLLLQTTPAHSESRQGRERGRSIPFASGLVPCFKLCFCSVGYALRDMRASRIVQQAQDVFLIGCDLDLLDENVVMGVCGSVASDPFGLFKRCSIRRSVYGALT